MNRSPQNRAGFTLLELLVTMATLALIIAFVAGIVNATQATTRTSNQAAVTDADARVAFDRIGRDFAGLLKRSDADFWACNPVNGQSGLAQVNSGNLSLLFLSAVTSDDSSSPSGGNRDFSVVSYQVAPSPNNLGAKRASLPCLLRAGKAVGLSGSDSHIVGLKANGLPVRFDDTGTQALCSSLIPSNTSADFDVLASGVVRMVIGFQLYPDNQPVALDGAANADPARGQVVYQPPVRQLTPLGGGAPVNYIDLERISAIVVGLVVIDNAALKLLSSDQVNLLAGNFTVPNMNRLPVQAWQTAVNGIVQSLHGQVPTSVLQSVHVYERVYPVRPRGQVNP